MCVMGRSISLLHVLVAGSKCGTAMRNLKQGEEGVQRALLESVVRLSCRDSVTADLATILEPLPEDELISYQLTHELYGSTRMLLACLTKEQLDQVGFLSTKCLPGSVLQQDESQMFCCRTVLLATVRIEFLVLCRSAAAGVVTWRRCWRL